MERAPTLYLDLSIYLGYWLHQVILFARFMKYVRLKFCSIKYCAIYLIGIIFHSRMHWSWLEINQIRFILCLSNWNLFLIPSTFTKFDIYVFITWNVYVCLCKFYRECDWMARRTLATKVTILNLFILNLNFD